MASNHSSLATYSASEPSSPPPEANPPKTRGRARGKQLSKEFDRNGKIPFDVSIPEEAGVPVGPRASQFISELSLLVKHYAPLTVKTWKERRFKIIEGNNSETKEMVLRKANDLYKNWRYTLGKIYKKYTTNAERLENIPDGVKKEAWEELIKWFGTPAFEKKSACGTASRGLQGVNQVIGRTSFQNKRFQNRDPETQKLPDNVDLWVLCHRKSNGEWADDISEKKYNDMIELTMATEGPPVSRDDAVVKILATRSGHIRGQGCGPRPAKRLMADRAERAERERDELKAMVATLDETLDMRVGAAIHEYETSAKKKKRFGRQIGEKMKRFGSERLLKA